MTERGSCGGDREEGAVRPCDCGRASPEPPGYGALAARIVDLWQDHLAHAAADPNLAAAMAATIRAAERMGASMSPWPTGPNPHSGASDSTGGNGGDYERTDGEAGGGGGGTAAPGAEAGAAAAAASPGVGGTGLDEFRRRLAALEERVLAVERRAERGLERDPGDGPGEA